MRIKTADVCEEFAWLFNHPEFGTTGLEDDAFSPERLAAEAAHAAAGSLLVAWDAGDLTSATYSTHRAVRKQLAKAEAALAATQEGTGAIEDVNMFWAVLLHKNELIERFVIAGGAHRDRTLL